MQWWLHFSLEHFVSMCNLYWLIVGIMLLEKQLLQSEDSRQSSRKRARGSAAPPSQETITWIELSRQVFQHFIVLWLSDCFTSSPYVVVCNFQLTSICYLLFSFWYDLQVYFKLLPVIITEIFRKWNPYNCDRLYRSLGDYDVLRGIFTGHIGTKPITQKALEAEARGDFSQALKLYNEVS